MSNECLDRARLEAERRYCDNKTEYLTWGEYFLSKRELGATLLDLWTVNAKHLSKENRAAAYTVLKSEYVVYATSAYE